MVVRTQEEINKTLEQLRTMRKNIPPRSSFGDDNYAALDVQILILEGKKSYGDYSDADDAIEIAADEAEYWLNNKDADPLVDPDDCWLNPDKK